MSFRIHTILTAIIASFLALVAVGLYCQARFNEQTESSIRVTEIEQLHGTHNQITKLVGESVHTLTYDYSYWDEMVHFTQSPDSTWAEVNLLAGMLTFKSDIIWVMRPNGEVIYAASHNSTIDPTQFPIPETDITWDSTASLFFHRFVIYQGLLLEFYTAPIQPSDDNQRITPAHGLLAAGKFWTADHLAAFDQVTGFNTTLHLNDGPHRDTLTIDSRAEVLSCIDTIFAPDNTPIAFVQTEHYSPLIAQLQNNRRIEYAVRTIIELTLVAVLYLLLYFAVSRPISLFASALSHKKPELLSAFHNGKTEMADLARTINRFFHQQEQLEKEMLKRQRAEFALEENVRTLAVAEQKYRRLVEMSPDAIFISQRGVIQFANKRAAQMLKYSSTSPLENTDFLTHIHPHYHEITRQRIAELESSRTEVPPLIQKYVAADGTAIDVEVISTSIMLADIPASLTVARDISERVRAEEENRTLRSKLEVAQRMEALAVLAGGVAHDLNNMLGPLVAYPELVLMDLPDDSPAVPNIKAMEKAAIQASDVIQDLLALGRRGRYEMKPMCINDAVRNYLESPSYSQLQARNPHVRVALNLSETSLPILGSDSHLQKVVMNLVVNAFDAIRNESGDVSITTECQSLTSLKGGYSGITPGNYVILSVSDTGVGIAPEDQQKIFEPYFSKKKMGTSGSGLGLAVVYGIVIDLSGYYDLKSDIGSGSTFTLYFPMTSKQLHVTADLKELYHGTEKILVVDDVAEQREVATALLSSLGYVVHTASTPTEAIQSAISNMYDLIVMDVNLESTLDGLDIYQEILSARPEQKAIVASGFSENDRVKQMLTLGAYGYLRKPYTRAALSRSVRQALDAPFRESTTTKIRFSEA